MKKLFALLIIVAFTLPFSGCKKGEGDPFLSFHSRKARIAGKWTLKTYKETSVNYNKSAKITTTTVLDYNGTTLSKTITSSTSSPNTVTYAYSESYTFDKDGKYTKITEDSQYATLNGVLKKEYEGQWNFTSSVGKDRKNKDQILMIITKTVSSTSKSSSSYTETYTGSDASNTSEYDIFQLKNKEIILKKKTSSDDASFKDDTDAEWTYEVGN